MANETIELLHNYNPDKMQWPAAHQEKIDGVPVIIKYVPRHTYHQRGYWQAFTRQGELVTSIPHILNTVDNLFTAHRDVELVGELFIAGLPFKTISGKVRKNEPCADLTLHLFDMNCSASERDAQYGWLERVSWLDDFLSVAALSDPITGLAVIPWTVCHTPDDAEQAHRALMAQKPGAEGSVLHSCAKSWEPAKRSWGVQRMKPVPTIDLRIVALHEATSEAGEPLGMVGRLDAEFTGADGRVAVVGVGPGKLTHKERKRLWMDYKAGLFSPRIAEIKFMRDDTYDALRQPTFQHWRDDKAQADTYKQAA